MKAPEELPLAYWFGYDRIDSLLRFYKKHTWKHARFKWKHPEPISDLANFIKRHLGEITKHKGKQESLRSLSILIRLKDALEVQIKRARKKKPKKKVNRTQNEIFNDQ